jgi:hypothetical protein
MPTGYEVGLYRREPMARVEAARLLVAPNYARGCDKCGLPVAPEDDAVALDIELGIGGWWLIGCHPRHLFPNDHCPGSPSRAQYLPGQPRDARPEYAYDERSEPLVRAAWERMVARAIGVDQ